MGINNSKASGLLALLRHATPAQQVQAFYVLSSIFVGSVAATPESMKKLLMNYGARNVTDEKKDAGQETSKTTDKNVLLRLVAYVTSLGQVPHSWFASFYGMYLTCALFWLSQYLTKGKVLEYLASQQAAPATSSMSIQQVALIWVMTFMQASRRIWEQLYLTKPSKSEMWFVHWLLGIAYYINLSMAIWVEGSGAILTESLSNTRLGVPSLRTVVGISGFLFAWVNQYRCHKHLFGLKKYSLPIEGLFRHFITAHYTCECLLYLSLAFFAAPEGKMWNKTLLTNLLFVAVNLGCTASSTRNWYIEKFGKDSVAGKWTMIPFLY